MIRLSDLAELAGAAVSGPNPEIFGVRQDSREVQPGDLFVAIEGQRFDGHDAMVDAISRGAGAVAVCDHKLDRVPAGIPTVAVPQTRDWIARWAVAAYGDPSRELHVTGVTGTNGKTTTVRMVDSLHRASGRKTGTIGTLGAVVDGVPLPHDRTTPEACDLQRLFAVMRAQLVTSVAMEVASHALVLGRVTGTVFNTLVFTNLSQDHLDFHGTMEAYRDAKLRLFTEHVEHALAAGKDPVVVSNVDDTAGRHVLRHHRARRQLTFSPDGDPGADLVPQNIRLFADRITFDARTPLGTVPVTLGFGGTFQVANALAALGAGIAAGLSADAIELGFRDCPPVPGRFEPVVAGQPFPILVDYAHTPDGLRNVLESARPLVEGRLIVVFGCGGDRDRTKRPVMGRIAADLADRVWVTSDNPRTEDPAAIVGEILAGIPAGVAVDSVVDRREAIRHALSEARAGDLVVIAGKGHETTQEIGRDRFEFDDRIVAREEWLRCASR